VNARDVWQATPLHKAVSCRNEAAVKLLLRAGAAVNVEDINHSTPLSMAKGTSLEPLLRSHAGR
jgi:ankyrin repeat protein